jgi:hypothetical protein
MRSFSLAMYGCACSGCYSACSASLCDSNTPQPSNGCLACIKANLGGADCTTGWQTCKASALCGPYGACVLGCL